MVCACVMYARALQGAVVVVQEEGWREAAGPAGVSRCGATELTGLGPSGRMCANHNLLPSAAAPSVVWLWCMAREEGEGERLGVGGAKASRGKVRKWRGKLSSTQVDVFCFRTMQCRDYIFNHG